jgi:hypothetical protein
VDSLHVPTNEWNATTCEVARIAARFDRIGKPRPRQAGRGMAVGAAS